jgi:hypothetical protein
LLALAPQATNLGDQAALGNVVAALIGRLQPAEAAAAAAVLVPRLLAGLTKKTTAPYELTSAVQALAALAPRLTAADARANA